VAFRVADRADLAARIGLTAARLGTAPVDVVIWTTTPWTLPANQAVALRAEFRYVLAQSGTGAERRRGLIVAAELLEPSLKRFGLGGAAVLAQFEGRALEGLKLQHPFQDRQVPVVLAEHVTLDAGTGAYTPPRARSRGFRRRAALRPAGDQPGRQRRALPARHPARRRLRWMRPTR